VSKGQSVERMGNLKPIVLRLLRGAGDRMLDSIDAYWSPRKVELSISILVALATPNSNK